MVSEPPGHVGEGTGFLDLLHDLAHVVFEEGGIWPLWLIVILLVWRSGWKYGS